MSTAYSAGQYADNYPTGIERHFWHVARNATILNELRRTGMEAMPLLDVGCGRGIVVDYLRRRGLDCIGCDPASPAVDPGLADAIFTRTDFCDLPEVQRARVRGALLCDVLEHVEAQGELLRALVRGLPSLTHVLVTVPARNELFSDWDVHYGHFRRYDLTMLRDEIAGAGLEVVLARYFLHALYPPMLLMRGTRRAKTIAAPRAASIHALLGKAFLLEDRLIPSWIPGSSLLAVARVR